MPAPKLKSIYGSGWNPEKKRMLDEIVLPPKLKCWECKKLKNATNFAEARMKQLREAIAVGQVKSSKLSEEGWILCRQCVGTQVSELECVHCNKVKGLDGFFKAQRRNPDKARCMECLTEHMDTEPYEGSAIARCLEKMNSDGDSGDDDTAYSNIESASGGVTVSTNPYDLNELNLASLNLSTGAKSSRSMTSNAASASASLAGTAQASSKASTVGISGWREMSHRNGGSGTAFTGYDTQSVPHRRMLAPPSEASDDSEATVEEDPKVLKAEKAARSKFAKEPSTRRLDSIYRPPVYRTRNVAYDHDSGPDENDDFFTI